MRTLPLAATLAAALTLTAATPALAADEGQGTACSSLVHVGDSLSVGTSAAGGLSAEERAEGRYAAEGVSPEKIRVDALSGRHITGGTEPGEGVVRSTLETTPTEPGRCWVIALGTNDVGGISTPAEASARINKIMDQIPEEEQVLWVEVASSAAAAPAFAPANMEKFNEALRAASEKRDNLHVAPWSAETDPSMFTDGIHLNKDGYAKLAAFTADHLPSPPSTDDTEPTTPSLDSRTVRLTAGNDSPATADLAAKVRQVLEAAGASVDGTPAPTTTPAVAPENDRRPLEGETVKLAGNESDPATAQLREALEAAGARVVEAGDR